MRLKLLFRVFLTAAVAVGKEEEEVEARCLGDLIHRRDISKGE